MKKLFLLTLLTPFLAHAYTSPGQPTGLLNDYATVFSSEQKSALETKLTNFQKATGNEIAVVTIPNLGGDSIENFSEKLFQEWGIGKEKEDNGVLLLIAVEDRQMRIEVGYGLEGDLTDILSSRIIRETLTPAFQKGDFYGGVNQALDQIIQITHGSVPTELEQPVNNFKFNFEWIWFAGFILLWLSSILARSKSWWLGGVVGGVFATFISFIFSFLFIGLIAFVVLIPLGLLFDFLVSRSYKNSKDNNTRPPWFIGGGGFGGGHGGGFGGFSGGSSGGGGSSGSW